MSLLLSSCADHFTEEELIGIYTPVDYKHCFDTIQLMKGGIYHRKVYDLDQKLLLDMDGKWNFENRKNNRINIGSYFHNLDRDLIKFPELVEDTIGGWSHMIERRKGGIEFCVGYLLYQNCYQKLSK